MGNLNVSNRYASAFYSNAEDKNILDSVADDMRMIYETLEGSRELRYHLASPILKDEKKTDILNAIFADKVNPDSINFLRFIVSKKRIGIISDIVKRFNDIHDINTGTADAEITTAVDIDESQKEELKSQLEQFTKKKLRLNYNVDASIIGGFKVKIADRIIDASLKNQLKKLRKALLN